MALDAIPREKVLSVIEKHGPVQPLDVRRALGEGDTMLLGAILSEMAATGLVNISKTKRGGSPFYYLPDKPETLEKIYEFLNEKDQRTFVKLKAAKVLNEAEQDPLTRVSLGNIPDYSRRFEANGIVYWRYFLVPENEACDLVTPKAEPVVEAPEVEEIPEEIKKIPAPKEAPQEEQEILQKPAGKLGERVYALGKISELNVIKEDHEVTAKLRADGPHGRVTYLVYAYARKTLPESLVWNALLKARSEGLPLLICKDSEFPKSLQKKFSDVPNVFFKRI